MNNKKCAYGFKKFSLNLYALNIKKVLTKYQKRRIIKPIRKEVYKKMSNKIVNWWIKKSRESAGITQQTLADMSGIPLATIKRIELSDGEPSQEQTHRIAKALNTEVTNISKKACMDSAIKAAKEIKAVAEKPELQARKIKLSNCLVSEEFDEIINTVLLLSATYNVNTQFLFPIIEDVKNECEHTKTVVYAFINAL